MVRIFILLFIISFSACTSEFLTKNELFRYIEDIDNGLTKTEIIDDIEVSVSYKPRDLLILQENGWDSKISTEEYSRLKSKYNANNYFVLELSRNDKELIGLSQVGAGNYSNLVENLSFRMGEYVKMTTSENDTISLSDYIFSRTYGMGKSSSILLAFSNEQIKNDEWIQINFKEFGLGIGLLNFRFDQSNILNTPSINFFEENLNNNIK